MGLIFIFVFLKIYLGRYLLFVMFFIPTRYFSEQTHHTVTSCYIQYLGYQINFYFFKEEDYSGAAKAVIKEKISKRAAKKLKKEEREKTVGKKWFDMPALELTEERKRDLELLQMRGVLDPKRFYKKSAQEEKIPKYFQVFCLL